MQKTPEAEHGKARYGTDGDRGAERNVGVRIARADRAHGGRAEGGDDQLDGYVSREAHERAGFVADGRIIKGVSDLAGEVGHHVLDPNGPPCGQRGCWEIFCGGLNVANRLRERIRKNGVRTAIVDCVGGDLSRVDFKAFIEAVRHNDAFACAYWEEYTDRLAQSIGTVIQFINPALIVLGTIGIHAADLILPPVQAKLPKYAWRYGWDACRIEPAALRVRIGDFSALAVAMANRPNC